LKRPTCRTRTANPTRLDFSFINKAKLDALVVGILAASLAGWVLMEGGDYIGSRGGRRASLKG
jgi:hypothetical protein